MALNHSVKGPVDYTIVGTPTIVDGVVSGFDGKTSYIKTSSTFTSANSLETVIKIKFSALPDYRGYIFNKADTLALMLASNGKLMFHYGDSINGWTTNDPNSVSATTLSVDTDYWAKLVYTGTTITLYLSTDGITYIQECSVSTTLSITPDSSFNMGYSYSSTNTAFSTGSIDLNHTYIKVNGQAWFGVCPVEVKHIDYGTSVGYTKVGSPTITNGVVSGFSGTDALLLTHNLDIKNGLEAVFKIHTASTLPGDNQYIMVYNPGNNSVYLPLGLWLGTSGRVAFSTRSGSIVSASPLNNDTDYYLKVTSSSGVYELFYGTDGVNYTSIGTKTDTDDGLTNHIELGAWTFASASLYRPLKGSIDLNESYIKLNGKLWFFRPCTNYLAKDNKLVFADKGLYLTGPVNYTVVGTPTIVDGVASGFSDNSKYLKTSSSLDVSKNFEISTKITTGDEFTANHAVFGFEGNTSVVAIAVNGKATFLIRYVKNGTPTALSVNTATALSVNTTYFIKAKREGRIITLSISTDGENWTSVNASMDGDYELVSNTAVTIGVNGNHSGAFNGSIDLNNTYIEVNGNLWFYGKNYASQNIAPVPSGYHFGDSQVACTAVGTPTITDGVVSGFSSSNYLQTSSSMDVTKPFEIFLKIKTAASSSSLENITQLKGTNSVIAINATSRRPAFLMRYYGTDSLLHSSTASFQSGFEDNAIYYLKCICDTNGTSISVSTDKTNWETLTKPLPDDFVSWHTPTAFILGSYTNNPFLGSIYLNETYVKVDNKMWFDGAKSATGVGWFDMRTQTFTAAPEGATIGRDE